jgi:glutathione S-transferase
MYTLYYSPGSASLAVHWMLLELKAPFSLVKVNLAANEQNSKEYLALNPSGQVPTLVVDGVPRAECAALLVLLSERHPDARLVPAVGDAARADYLQMMFYLANTLQPAFRQWFYPDEAAGVESSEAAKAHARARIERVWSRLDARLGDGRQYLLGQNLTSVDFLGTMLMRWSRNMPVPATSYRNIAAYLERMRKMPSLRLVHQKEELTEWIDG